MSKCKELGFNMTDPFYLKQGDNLIATLNVDSTDQPWFFATFSPTPLFTHFTFLFDEELKLSKSKKWEGWKLVQNKIFEKGLYILKPNGEKKDRFILHIEKDKAKLRFI